MLPEPLSVQFANTRTSTERDHIRTRTEWRAWVRISPGLKQLGLTVDSNGLASIRCLRDDVQSLLRAAANRNPAEKAALSRAAQLARSHPSYEMNWTPAGLALVVGEDDPATVIAHHLARSAFDLLLSTQADTLRACEGSGCLKVFVSGRPDRRWCDSNVCGNRARVSLHTARHH